MIVHVIILTAQQKSCAWDAYYTSI